MKTIGRFGCAALSLLFAGFSPAQIVWDFSSGTGTPSSVPDHLTGGLLSAGNMAGSLVFNATSACTLSDSSKGNNAALRTSETAAFNAEASTYFEFTLIPEVGYQVAVTAFSFNTRRSSSGPAEVMFYTSLDNYSLLEGKTSLSNETWTKISFDQLSIVGTAGSPVTFRIYGSPSGTASSPNWRIDDLALSAGAVAIPEPVTTLALLGGAALTAAIVSRCNRRKRVQMALPATPRAQPISSPWAG